MMGAGATCEAAPVTYVLLSSCHNPVPHLLRVLCVFIVKQATIPISGRVLKLQVILQQRP